MLKSDGRNLNNTQHSQWSFHSAGQVVFGSNAVEQLGMLTDELAARRVLVVTDAQLQKAGIVDRAVSSLVAAGLSVEVYAEGVPEPALHHAEACAKFAATVRPDAVVGLGGGSNIDLAKITAVLLTFGGTPRDYLGEARIPGPTMATICLPTTAGTGSEVSCSAVLTDEDNDVKVSTLSNHLRPRLALVDPTMTLTCPPKVTADSGIDALTHAIEAYTATDSVDLLPEHKSIYQGSNPLGDALAEKAISLIGANLIKVVREPNDLAAREAMSLGATLAGLAFSNAGVALVHALEYPVGAVTHCSHGAGNGLFLPYVMGFNLPARANKLARVAQLLGECVQGKGEIDAAKLAIAAIERLNESIGIPCRLRELGANRAQLPLFAEKTFGIKRLLRINPRAASLEDLQRILEEAF